MPSPKKANWFMFFVLLYTVLIACAMTYIVYNFRINVSLHVYILVSSILSPVLPVLYYFFINKGGARGVMPTNSLGFINAVMLTAIAICVQPVLMVMSGVGSLMFPNPVAAALDAVYSTELPKMLITAVSVVALPAVFEELLMRGIILAGDKYTPFFVAATANALFFGMWHMNFQQFFYAFAMGYLFCYVVRLTKSIYASIYVHMLVNGIQYVLQVYSMSLINSGAIPPAETAGSEYDMLVTAILDLLPLAIMSLSTVIILLYAFFHHNKRKNGDALARKPVFPRPPVFTAGFWGSTAVFFGFLLLSMISTYIASS